MKNKHTIYWENKK